jgi:hypothetical protein
MAHASLVPAIAAAAVADAMNDDSGARGSLELFLWNDTSQACRSSFWLARAIKVITIFKGANLGFAVVTP